jgi:hypothetical protein
MWILIGVAVVVLVGYVIFFLRDDASELVARAKTFSFRRRSFNGRRDAER